MSLGYSHLTKLLVFYVLFDVTRYPYPVLQFGFFHRESLPCGINQSACLDILEIKL